MIWRISQLFILYYKYPDQKKRKSFSPANTLKLDILQDYGFSLKEEQFFIRTQNTFLVRDVILAINVDRQIWKVWDTLWGLYLEIFFRENGRVTGQVIVDIAADVTKLSKNLVPTEHWEELATLNSQRHIFTWNPYAPCWQRASPFWALSREQQRYSSAWFYQKKRGSYGRGRISHIDGKNRKSEGSGGYDRASSLA